MWMRCRGLRGERANALIEVAFTFSLLGMPLLIGTADMGFVVYDSEEVSNAAHAGAMYGMQSSTNAANTSGMTTAAQNEATDFGTNLTVTPTSYYACSSAIGGTQYTGSSAQSNATTACTGGTNHALQFVQVNTSVTVTPPIHLPLLPHTFTVTGSSVMEVEQ
jgi:Flp pilus assembly protein TadG